MSEEKKHRLKKYQKNYDDSKKIYSKEKASAYYTQNKETIKEKSREHYKN